jgi:hypothetical protein
MALPFKAPKINLKGKTFGISNTLAYPAIGAILLGGGYLAYQQMAGGKLNLGNLFGPPAKTSPKAVRVNFSVYPPTIKPFRKIRLQGQFEDANGIPAPVEYGYYSIFESVPAGADFRAGRLLVSSGIVGQNVGAFRQDIATDNLRTGPYVVYVSNRPIRTDPIAGNQAALTLAGGRSIAIG